MSINSLDGGKSEDEIGLAWGISHERVGQLVHKAIRKLWRDRIRLLNPQPRTVTRIYKKSPYCKRGHYRPPKSRCCKICKAARQRAYRARRGVESGCS